MRTRSVFTFVIGLGLAAGAAYLVDQKIRTSARSPAGPATPGVEMGSVVVAKVDFAFGDRLTPELLSVVEWPAKARPVGSFQSIDELAGEDAGRQRAALRQIVAGEPILASKITGPGMRASMSIKLPEDMRAVAIPINDVSGVAGFVLPGDRVDIMLTRTLDEQKDLATDIILQNVLVLGIDQLVDEGREEPKVGRTVTVAVTTEEAQKLALAQKIGGLSLALRHINAVTKEATGRVEVSDLVNEKPIKAADRTIKVRRGNQAPVAVAIKGP